MLFDNATALQKLKTGEIAALVRVIGKPIDFFAKLPPNSGLHYLPITFSKTFSDYYTLGELTSQEYPTLVPSGEKVDTIAVPAVLAVFNWQKNTDRYRRVQRFTDALFAKWDKFLQPPRHPKWRDVNLAATVPGWTRWAPAEEALRRSQPPAEAKSGGQVAGGEFDRFLRTTGSSVGNLNQEQRDALFREFLLWQQRQGSKQR